MRRATICFIGENSKVILDRKLIGLPLKDDFIIKRSIEFFNDPEPCMIHRSAVMKRTYMEFYEYFQSLSKEGKDRIAWDEVPSFVKESVDIGCIPHRVKFCIKNK